MKAVWIFTNKCEARKQSECTLRAGTVAGTEENNLAGTKISRCPKGLNTGGHFQANAN